MHLKNHYLISVNKRPKKDHIRLINSLKNEKLFMQCIKNEKH